MNTSADMAINVIDVLRHFASDVHVIVMESKKHPSGDIAIIPTDNGSKVDTRGTSTYNRIPIKEFFDDIKSINAGITSITDSEEKKLYFASGTPSIIGSHEWAYSVPFDELTRLRNFCKVRFNTCEFIYVLFVDNIYDQEDVIAKIKKLEG